MSTRWLGEPVARREDPRLLTGQGRYLDDLGRVLDVLPRELRDVDETVEATEVDDDDLILDIGPQTARQLAAQLMSAGTIVWNGPVGVFEFDAFAHGTETIARAIAK